MPRCLYVSIGDGPDRKLVGTLYFNGYGRRLSTVFSYAPEWIADQSAFPLNPLMPLDARAFSAAGLPGFADDSAPDRWGRMLIEKAIRQEAAAAGRPPRAVDDFDYLARIDDWSRMGAWRYSPAPQGEYVARGSNIPRLVHLPKLLNAAMAVDAETPDEYRAIKELLSVGTSALGGAHPKATVMGDDQRLYIAKFPRAGQGWDAVRWEAVCMRIASLSGVTTPRAELVDVGEHKVLVEERFDRIGTERIPFMSGMTLLGARDHSQTDYLDLADRMNAATDNAEENRLELFRRVVCNVAVNNIDDHARNHGFLWDGVAWNLSPAYDMTCSPANDEHRRMSICGIAGPEEAGALGEFAELAGIKRAAALQVVEEVLWAAESWEEVAHEEGCRASEIRLMEATIALRREKLEKVAVAMGPTPMYAPKPVPSPTETRSTRTGKQTKAR